MSVLTDLLINKDQYPLRIELERRRGMLKFDAKDHQYIEIFYNLKPRETEIYTAKSIWNATNHEQTLRYEIEIFKTWINFTSNSNSCYTFEELQLTIMNAIFKEILSAQQQTDTQLLEHWIQQILNLAERKAESYAKK